MTTKPRASKASDSTPSQPVDVASPLPSAYEPSHVIQLLVNMQGEIRALSTKTDRLITDVNKIEGQIGKLDTAYHRAWGFGLGAILIIPFAAAVVWWLIGTQLTDIRNAVQHMPVLHEQAQPLPPTGELKH